MDISILEPGPWPSRAVSPCSRVLRRRGNLDAVKAFVEALTGLLGETRRGLVLFRFLLPWCLRGALVPAARAVQRVGASAPVVYGEVACVKQMEWLRCCMREWSKDERIAEQSRSRPQPRPRSTEAPSIFLLDEAVTLSSSTPSATFGAARRQMENVLVEVSEERLDDRVVEQRLTGMWHRPIRARGRWR